MDGRGGGGRGPGSGRRSGLTRGWSDQGGRQTAEAQERRYDPPNAGGRPTPQLIPRRGGGNTARPTVLASVPNQIVFADAS